LKWIIEKLCMLVLNKGMVDHAFNIDLAAGTSRLSVRKLIEII